MAEQQQISIKPSVGQTVTGIRPSLPGTILLADKNGIRVEVESVAGLPQTPVAVSLQPAPTPLPTQAVVAAPAPVTEVIVQAAGPASTNSVTVASTGNVTAGALPAEELKTTIPNVVTTTLHPAASRSYIVTTGPPGGNPAPGSGHPGNTPNTRPNLDSIVDAIRHLEGDHLFSEDSHKVRKFGKF